jgi:hypothetical protein
MVELYLHSPICLHGKVLNYLSTGTIVPLYQIGLVYLTPDYWLEVSVYPEGPAPDQLDHDFPWVFSVLEQMLSWYPSSTLHCNASHAALPITHSNDLAQLLSSAKSTSYILPFSLPKALPSLKHDSTRRTSGHCLETFEVGISLSSPPFNVASLTSLPHFHLSVSLSI